MELRYHSEHRGEHEPWIATDYVSVSAARSGHRAAWRRAYRFEDIGKPTGMTIAGATVVDAATLLALDSEDTFGPQHSRLAYGGARITGSDSDGDGRSHAVDVPAAGAFVTDVWHGFDLWLLALPLRVGYRARLRVLYETAQPPRPFVITVERVEQVRVPAGDFAAFRVRVDPEDGDRHMQSIYHVRTGAIPVVLRKEYVVNPETRGDIKRSTAVEELEALRLVD